MGDAVAILKKLHQLLAILSPRLTLGAGAALCPQVGPQFRLWQVLLYCKQCYFAKSAVKS